MWILCPNPSCNEELVQQDLINLIGLPAVRDYERWMANYYDILYKPAVSKTSSMVCLSANCDQQVTSAILADRISDLSTVEVKHALDVRGLSFPNCTKRSCVKLLLSNIGGDPKHTDALWVCTTCEAAWCGGCGVRMPLNILQSKTHNASHLFCDRQRKYPIYKAIHDLKKAWHYYTSGSENLDKRPSTGAGKILSQTIWADGTGFGGDRTENKSHIHSMQKAAKKAESNFDGQVENAIDILIDALDHSKKATVADSSRSISSATCALINWDDTLRQVLCHLATNDSMLDISERKNIYLKMAALIKILASYSELVPLLTEGLSSQASSETTDDLGKGIENTTSSSLMTKMKNIYKQTTIMLHNMEAESSDPRANVDINLAKELCSCYEALAEALKSSGVAQSQEIASSSSSGHNSGFLESLLPSLKYKETLKLLQFKLVSIIDGNGEYRHYFKKEIVGQVEGSTSIDRGGVHNHKRTLHISKEIASLSTTLPLEWESSIHLCVDEERMDVLKALIIGPCGTPYQNGIFIFDMFLPPDYPQVPPKVRFLTTGGGRVRFNPNLYESGVVCLSLLGTWNGPGWVAGKSTLLQVLVSIQSLIFVKDPYYNEPGFERVETPQAEIENMRHRKNTLSYAILAALRKPDTFFEEIIFEHFRLKKTEIEVQCDQWVASASEADRSGMAFVAKQIKAELHALDS
ncbi:hypothetical protein O6H91_14G027500 [Diphasiastrum complanatum]|nr:hypothetical protein O6H91_14G027500 [Diphasiastrum complanatum]KAJ7530994.1 hypothetical protein O6H91_14G027500 [Diphasiastrum complanatum]